MNLVDVTRKLALIMGSYTSRNLTTIVHIHSGEIRQCFRPINDWQDCQIIRWLMFHPDLRGKKMLLYGTIWQPWGAKTSSRGIGGTPVKSGAAVKKQIRKSGRVPGKTFSISKPVLRNQGERKWFLKQSNRARGRRARDAHVHRVSQGRICTSQKIDRILKFALYSILCELVL